MRFERYLEQIGRASRLWSRLERSRRGIDFWRAENLEKDKAHRMAMSRKAPDGRWAAKFPICRWAAARHASHSLCVKLGCTPSRRPRLESARTASAVQV